MSSRELALWRAFDEVEPIGDWRGDLQAGIIASTTANYAGKAMKEGSEPMTPRDFMPLVRKREPSKSEKTKEMIKSMRKYFSNLARKRGRD